METKNFSPPTRALISLSDKAGLEALVGSLVAAGVSIFATTGTLSALSPWCPSAKDVSTLTNFAPILEGRVKTLHPAVFGAILARRDEKRDRDELAQHAIEPIDIVVVTLYPFERAAMHSETLPVESIDIGGVSLLRAAAKNHQHCIVLSAPAQYPEFCHRLKTQRLDDNYRFMLAGAAFAHTSRYDAAIAAQFERFQESTTPPFAATL